MPTLALALGLTYIAIVFVLRVLVHKQRTGRSGLLKLNGKVGSPAWFSGTMMGFGAVLGTGSLILSLSKVLDPIGVLNNQGVHIFAVVLFVFGLGFTSFSQFAMGESWRVGVNPSERTALVTNGPFTVVRNPIYAATLPAFLGLSLLIGNWAALVAFASGFAGLELLVRGVEEPYLIKLHGDAYRAYASQVGRFLPGIGKISK